MRLFIAINFQDFVKAEIAKLRNELQKSALNGKFSESENLHLTLAFLGECDINQTKTIKAVMNDAEFSPFLLVSDRIVFFKRDNGGIYSIFLKENEQLTVLQAGLSKRLTQAGFTLDERKFTPHITLAREVKMPTGTILSKIEKIEFLVSSIELMKSERINNKLIYTPMYSKAAKS